MVQHDGENAAKETLLASVSPKRFSRQGCAMVAFYVSTADFKESTKRVKIPGLYESNICFVKGKPQNSQL